MVYPEKACEVCGDFSDWESRVRPEGFEVFWRCESEFRPKDPESFSGWKFKVRLKIPKFPHTMKPILGQGILKFLHTVNARRF